MPLGQACHSSMARLWAEFKRQWCRQGNSLSIFAALKAIGEITDAALDPQIAQASWAQIGLKEGEAFSTDKIFVERMQEICMTSGFEAWRGDQQQQCTQARRGDGIN